MSAYSMMYMGFGPFGAMFAGLAADRFGAALTLSVGAAVCLIASALFVWRTAAIREGIRVLLAKPATVTVE
jgi:hypothetical protein